MDQQQIKELMAIYAIEARLAARSRVMALAAKATGDRALGIALEAAAASRQVRAERLLRLARGKTGKGKEALLQEFERDCTQSAEAYAQHPNSGQPAVEQGGRVDKLMPGLAQRAAAMDDAADPPSYAVCGICGFVKQGQPPPKCPVCGALQSKFKLVGQSSAG
jgi:rubrerythrin